MVLEKVGLPPKPSERGKSWTVDATNCESCQSLFSIWNRKHHCRRCGGLFCNNCTQQRQVLRGQGDSPVRICEACKKLDDATKFEMRYGKNRSPKGGTKASSKDDNPDAVLKQLLGHDERSLAVHDDLDSILASVADTDSDEQELGFSSQRDGERGISGKHKRHHSDEIIDGFAAEEKEPISPAKLHQQAQEEKKKHLALKREGKDSEALKAFKRGKELERQAEALEKSQKKNQRRASIGSSSHLSGQRSNPSPNPDSPPADVKSLDRQQSEPGGESFGKRRAVAREQAKGKRLSIEEDNTLLSDLKELGWTDKEIREADKKVKSEEQLLAELAGEAGPKPRAATAAASESPMSMQILAHKRKALALKREGNMTEAKEELKKAKILERQVEEMALLGQGEGEDEASDDDELAALIRGLEKEEKSNSHSQRVASHALPDDFSLPNFGDDDDDSNVEVDDDDLNDPEMVAALRAMGWEEEAAGLEYTSKTRPKGSTPSQPAELSLKDQILARKRKALALKREGNATEARAELMEARKLEQKLEELESTKSAPVVQAPELLYDDKVEAVEDEDEKVEVTDEDMHDPEMLAALRAMGFGEDESIPLHKPITAVVKPSGVEKATLQQEILAIKKQALAMKREGRVTEAREELRHAKELEHKLQDLQAVFQRQKEAPALVKESRAIRRGVQALPALTGASIFDEEHESEDVDVTDSDLMDPEIAAALAAVGWKESIQETPTEESQSQTAESKKSTDLPSVCVQAEPVHVASVPIIEEDIPQKTEMKDSKPVLSGPQKTDSSPLGSDSLLTMKTKSQLQQELLGRKRRALQLKREGKSEEARVELREAKIIEQKMEDLEKIRLPSTSTRIPQNIVEKAEDVAPGVQRAAVSNAHSTESFEASFRQDSEGARPVYLDDEPVEEVDVTEDDMRNPDMLAALQSLGWQGEPEASPPTKAPPAKADRAKVLPEKGIQLKPQTSKNNLVGKSTRAPEMVLMDLDWSKPSGDAKKAGKNAVVESTHKEEISQKNGKEEDEYDPFEGEYGEIGTLVDIAPPLLDHPGSKAPAPQKPQSHWQVGFLDLLSGDIWNSNQNEETKKVSIKPQAREGVQAITRNEEDEEVEEALDPELMSALKGLGLAPEPPSMKRTETSTRPKEVQKETFMLPPPPPVTHKKPTRPPPGLPTSKPVEDVQSRGDSSSRSSASENPSRQGLASTPQHKPSLQQEILAHKRKALALKRDGKAAEALEELRQAKLLERQLGEHGLMEVTRPAGTLSSTGKVDMPSRNKVEDVPSSQVVKTNPTHPLTTSPPTKGPAHKEEMRLQVRQSKDRMKLQQDSLAHKRKAMGLRREGKSDEADAEYELAKDLERQMEDLDPTHAREDLDDVGGVEDLLDPQLLAALKGVGFKEGELAGGVEHKGMVRQGPSGVGQPSVAGGSKARVTSQDHQGGPSRSTWGSLEERKQLEERIRGQKVKAVEFKRAGKQAEALEMLRGAKRLEKQLLSLSSQS